MFTPDLSHSFDQQHNQVLDGGAAKVSQLMQDPGHHVDPLPYVQGSADPVVDCPFAHGTPEAKAWFYQISDAAKAAKLYQGKVLAAANGPNLDLLTDRFQVAYGWDAAKAQSVAGSIAQKIAALPK